MLKHKKIPNKPLIALILFLIIKEKVHEEEQKDESENVLKQLDLLALTMCEE